jgi:hypothetical protein
MKPVMGEENDYVCERPPYMGSHLQLRAGKQVSCHISSA